MDLSFKRYAAAAFLVFGIISQNANAQVSVKVRDIAFIDGLKENQVFGYGIVVGLQGSGDSKKSPIAQSSLQSLLKNLGLDGSEIATKNTAAVLLTAQLPAFVRVGDRVDITVSSIGDARSLEGGVLVQSVLKGGDNNVYVAAQGQLSIQKSRDGGRGVRTVASVQGGGLVEREISSDVVNSGSLSLVLKNWDYSVASSIIKEITAKYPESKPEVTSGGKIKLILPEKVNISEFISAVENIEVTPVYRARVVINERDGTIVTGGEVKISEAMVSREGVTVEIAGSDKKNSAVLLKEAATVKDLVDAMNSMGAGTRDIIAILKALKEAGSLHADLVVK